MNSPFYLYGAGGHGAECLEAAIAAGYPPDAVLDDHPGATHLLGVPVFQAAAFLRAALFAEQPAFRFLVAIGDTAQRRDKFEGLLALGGIPQTIVHPRAYISPSASIGPGSIVLALGLVGARAQVGANTIINVHALVGHDCLIGNHAHVSGNASLGGNCHVQDGAWVGLGASVKEGVTIGSGAFVGLGAMISHDVPENARAITPARARELADPACATRILRS